MSRSIFGSSLITGEYFNVAPMKSAPLSTPKKYGEAKARKGRKGKKKKG